MPPDNDVDTTAAADESMVVVWAAGVADVGERDDKVTLLLFLQEGSPLVDYLGIVECWDLAGDLVRDQGRNVRHQADYANLHAGLADYGVRLDVLSKLELRKVVVGTDHRALDLGHPPGKFIDSVVKFMVAKRDAVILQGIDHIHFDIASQDGKIGCTLAEVPGMEEKYVPPAVRLHYTVPAGCTFDHSSKAVFITGTFRFHVAVGVIEMNDSESLLGVDSGSRDQDCHNHGHRCIEPSHSRPSFSIVIQCLFSNSTGLPAAVSPLT